MTARVLVARLDNAGDVLLTGPAVRAVAAADATITFLAGPAGADAARLLPGVAEVLTWTAPWVPDPAPPVDPAAIRSLVAELQDRRLDAALILTSFHQSPLPLALLLRLAGIGRIAATSVDYPGSLLDVRVAEVADRHEVEQGLAVAAALGFPGPEGDDGRLAVTRPPADVLPQDLPYVVLHPGASVPARGIPLDLAVDIARVLDRRGRRVVVTGSPDDARCGAAITATVPGAVDHVGRTDLAGLAEVIRAADALVVGNTGPAHLAAAVGTPVAAIFAPTVSPGRWAPWKVPHRLLGRHDISCAGCRARRCPIGGQPCLAGLDGESVADAVDELVGMPALQVPSGRSGR